MARATRKGHLDEMKAIDMNGARKLYRRLRKSGKVRRSFRRWFRCEIEGIKGRASGKARVIAG